MSDGQIKSYFERWQRLEEAKAEISEDLKELFAEAKSFGFDTKAMRLAFRAKVKADSETPEDREFAAIVDTYLAAIDDPSSGDDDVEDQVCGILAPNRAHPATAHEKRLNNFGSVQSHDAAVVSEPAESSSDAISATNQPETAKDSPHHLVPTRGDDAAMASSHQEGATGRQPVDTLRAGRTGSITVTAGETATNSNPQKPTSSQVTADKAEAPNSSPDASAVNSEPKPRKHPLRPHCQHPYEEVCGGCGDRHCTACLKAARESEAA